MISSTSPENIKHAELAVTAKLQRGTSNTKYKASSSLGSLQNYTSSSSDTEDTSNEGLILGNQGNKPVVNKSVTTISRTNDNNPSSRNQNMSLMHFLVIYNREILCFLTLVLTTYATFHNKYASRTIYYPINSRPIFDKDSVVEEFYKGQLTPLQTKASVSSISAVLFYAPWSTNSIYVKQYFESLARVFQNEIYFAAVNCWQPGGECRIQHSKVKSWPVLVVYYPKSIAVQYNGPWQLGPLYKFMSAVLKPLKRLHTFTEFKQFLEHNSVAVVGFFKSITTKYRNFYGSAAKWLEYDPLQDIKFCTVVGDVLNDFGIINDTLITVYYNGEPITQNFSSWSINSIVYSLKKITKSFDKYWAGYHRQDTYNLGYHLESNPTLLYFVKRDYLNDNNTAEALLNEVITSYNKKYNVTQKINNHMQIESNEILKDNVAEVNETLLSRKMKMKNTLKFFLLDIFMYYRLAFQQLGLSNYNFKLQQSTVIIVDKFKESIFVFPNNIPLTNSSLIQFLDDYNSNNLVRNYRIKNITEEKVNSYDDNYEIVKIPEINGNEFNNLINNRNSTKTTSVILISTAACSLCSALKLNLLRIAKVFQNLPINFYRIDGNNNDLLWEYTMGLYPTVLLIPKIIEPNSLGNLEFSQLSSINEIKTMPYDIQPNEKNILGFIMANLDIPERLYSFLKYCEKTRISCGFFSCLNKTRQIINSIINEQLILWRNFSRRRNCIKKNLEILRELYYNILNAKHTNDISHAYSILFNYNLDYKTNYQKKKKSDKLHDLQGFNHIDINFSCNDKDLLQKNHPDS